MKQLARNANALATSAQLPAVAEEEVPLWLVLYLNLAADWQAANPEPDEWDEEDAYEAYNNPVPGSAAATAGRQRPGASWTACRPVPKASSCMTDAGRSC